MQSQQRTYLMFFVNVLFNFNDLVLAHSLVKEPWTGVDNKFVSSCHLLPGQPHEGRNIPLIKCLNLIHLLENTFDQKRISANSSPNNNSSLNPKAQNSVFGLTNW